MRSAVSDPTTQSGSPAGVLTVDPQRGKNMKRTFTIAECHKKEEHTLTCFDDSFHAKSMIMITVQPIQVFDRAEAAADEL